MATYDASTVFNEAFFQRISSLTCDSVIEAAAHEREEMANTIRAKRDVLHDADRNLARSASVSSKLGYVLLRYYSQFGDIAMLEEAIHCFESTLTSGELEPAAAADVTDALGDALRHRYMHTTDEVDVKVSISYHEHGLETRTSQDLNPWPSLQGIGECCFWQAYHYTTDRQTAVICIDRAAVALDQAVESVPVDSPERARSMAFLALVLAKHNSFGTADSIKVQQLAFGAVWLSATDVHLAIFTAFSLYYLDAETSKKIIHAHRRLLACLCAYAEATGHPDAPFLSLMLSRVEMTVWTNSSAESADPLSTLSAEHARIAVLALPLHHIHRRAAVQALAFTLYDQYAHSGKVSLLDEAIEQLRGWLQSAPSPSRPLLNNLGMHLQERHRLTFRKEDLLEARAHFQTCTSVFPVPTLGSLIYYIGLASCNIDLSRHVGGSLEYLNKAIEIGEACMLHVPHYAHLSSSVDGIADVVMEALLARYVITHEKADLERTINIGAHAIAQHPAGTPGQGETMSSMANAYRMLGFDDGRSELFQKAVELHESCLKLSAPIDAQFTSRYHEGLAEDFTVLARQSGSLKDKRCAMLNFVRAVHSVSGGPRHNLAAAFKWVNAADELDDSSALSDAFDEVFKLLPRIVYLGSELKPRMDAIKKASGLASRAAFHALRQHNIAKALEWLEQGRSIFWSRAMQPRQPFQDLPEDILLRLQEICRILERHSADERMVLRGQQLTEEFDELVETIRGYPGREYFLKTRPFDGLRQASQQGPIVILLRNDAKAYAVVIPSPTEEVRCILVDDITGDRLTKMIGSLSEISGPARRDRREDEEEVTRRVYRRRMIREDPVHGILSDVWRLILFPVIQALGMPKAVGTARPRLWICPVGDFVFLPIHAAGVYTGLNKVSITDYCVPSYISSIQSLLDANRSPPPILPSNSRIMFVAEPDAPWLHTLPNTAEEARILTDIAPPTVDVSTIIGGTTVKDITMRLQDASILHLACHGLQDRQDPLQSGFGLHDGKLTVSELMNLRMDKASVALLSACESAAGDRGLPDEAVHLAAAMMFIGFRSVVGTMWNMHDADGPTVMRHIYTALFTAGAQASYDIIPYALDAAVRQLRNDGVPASRWATYIHMGI